MPPQVEGVAQLADLMVLDLSHNCVDKLIPAQLPKSMRFLKVCWRCCCIVLRVHISLIYIVYMLQGCTLLFLQAEVTAN